MTDVQLRHFSSKVSFLNQKENGVCFIYAEPLSVSLISVAEYSHSGIGIAIEPINLANIRDLTDGYVVMFRNSEFEHEMEGDLYEALSQAVDRLKIAVVLFREIISY